MGWTTQQLVLDADGKDVRAVPNVDHRDPLDFDTATGGFIPRMGTLALLQLAARAGQSELIPTGLHLRDRSMHYLPDEVEEDISDQIVEALRVGDVVRAQQLLRGERGPYAVMAVHLTDIDGSDVRVGRFGELETTSEHPIDRLLGAARVVFGLA